MGESTWFGWIVKLAKVVKLGGQVVSKCHFLVSQMVQMAQKNTFSVDAPASDHTCDQSDYNKVNYPPDTIGKMAERE